MGSTRHSTANTAAPGFEIRIPGWFRKDYVRLAAFALIAASLVWKGSLFARGYFFGDDFNFVARASEQGFGFDYLTSSYGPKLLPVGFAVAWVVTRLGVYDWTLAWAALLALQAATSFAVYRMLRTIFGARAGIVLPLAFYLFTPLTLPGLLWWAAGLESVPLQLAIALALTSHVLWVRTGRLPHAVAACCWLVLGFASYFLKAAVAIPLLALLVTLAYEGGRPALRHAVPLWTAYAAVFIPCAVLYAARADTSDQPVVVPPLDDSLLFLGRLLGRTYPSVAVGGPGGWLGGLADPTALVQVVAVALLLGFALFTIVRRPGAWRAWAILVAYLVLVDYLPVLLGRGTFELQALEPRYLADAALATALCAAFATLTDTGERAAIGRLAPVVGLLTGAFLVASFLSGETYAGGFEAQRVKAETYMNTARATLAALPPTTDLYPQRLPTDVLVYAGVGEANLSTHILSPLAPPALRERMRHPRPSATPKMLDPQGRLTGFHVCCGYIVPDQGTRCFPASGGAITIAFGSSGDPEVGGFHYLDGVAGTATVQVGDVAFDVPIGAGDGSAYFPLEEKGSALVVKPNPPLTQLCVNAAVLGAAGPSS
ncbi:hypothetical protein J5X84_02745 [Streptosporangiaceae bacterium NEAU-GS5]|nr:hypothetical protein [Streptosporangiaceae bacterium NEAU-GS5]